ncbi:MAG: ABC transporter ATP-binding protein [Kiritimatiellae bacterium]|nr:ABC transporter ATP-binding protein [Kiritimatiellia bacterium]MDW8458686.1 ABC transporter ATP-binding protein [Verrucomicrobiota bacterium]
MILPAIEARQLTKRYRLGSIGRQSLADEVAWIWARIRGRDADAAVGIIGRSRTRPAVHTALDGVSFQVAPGEAVGLIGHNGAGKSTLLKILSRITDPTSGEAFLRGRVGSLLEVGTGFHPDLTGRENIFMSGILLGMRRQEVKARFDEIVDFAGVEPFIDTPVKRYSSGMFVRLAFSVAAHLETEILLVDEVLAVGDLEFQRKCLGKMDSVARSGRTILFVSHNLASVRSLCSRGIVLRKGRIQFDGAAGDAVNAYMQSYAEDVSFGRYKAPPDSLGQRDAWIEEIWLERGAKETASCPSGEDLEVVFRYGARVEGLPIHVAFWICDELHQKLIQFGQRFRQPAGAPSQRRGSIRCRIPRIPLMPGRYKLHAALYLRGFLIDHAPDAFWFEIQPGDFFGDGLVLHAAETRVLVDQHWVVEE